MTERNRKSGVLLLQLGTPDSPDVGDVRRYLKEFLSDPRVLDVPGPTRWLMLKLLILPFRPRQSARAYASIWSGEGSPHRLHSMALRDAVAKRLGESYAVELGMRYGKPPLEEAMRRLLGADVERIIALPLFPQYASSSSGSSLERVNRLAGSSWNVPPLVTLGPFYEHPGFIEAQAELAKQALEGFGAEHVLMSYHGLPERQVRKSDPGGAHCLALPDCCRQIGPANRNCYRAQCAATTRALAAALDLGPDEHSMSFQSRLGGTPWIRPYTDLVLPELAARGVRRLAVICPSFVADCLETLEEIGIRARQQWSELGGEAFQLVPCVNATPRFVEAVAEMLRART